MNFVHEVNAYVNSRHPQPASSHFSEDEPRKTYAFHNIDISPEWKAALDAYHDELDRLREDWALDVCGRITQEMNNFAGRRNPEGCKMGLQTLPWYIPKSWFTKTYCITSGLRRYLEFRVKEPIYPNSWKFLRQVYVYRMKDINYKYYNRIGIKRLAFGNNRNTE